LITSTLTVRENVAFSAFVRLSSDTPADERERRVDDVISKMDLENCANTRVRIIIMNHNSDSSEEQPRSRHGPQSKITRKPASIFPDNNGVVLFR